MTDALFKLTSWLSPAYPVGAYTYSHGLEQAVEAGDVRDGTTASAWIADCLTHGAGRSDAILLVAAHRAAGREDQAAISEICALALALAPSTERLRESEAQGRAFTEVTEAAWPGEERASSPSHYAVTVGVAAARHGIAVEPAVTMFLHAFASNLISACVRLVPLGQTEGQQILAGLMPLCLKVADDAMKSDIDDVGGCAILADIASMKHETQTVRLFRS